MGRVPESPLTIEPPAGQWPERLSPFPSLSPQQRRFREQLGLPTDRPVIMTGHQAQIWHPGILAKYLAAAAAGRTLGAIPAWLVVDQDDNDPGTVRFPVKGADGRLRAREWHSAPEAVRGAPTGLRTAFEPIPPPAPPQGATFAAPSVEDGLRRVHLALVNSKAERSAAHQVAAALAELMRPLIQPAPTVFATGLAATDAFAAIVEQMKRDPMACALAYNRAALRHPRAGIRPLDAHAADGAELPLWKFEGPRRSPVHAGQLADIDPARVAPRALLMTGLLRSGACDLFIHGTGGGGPDAGEGYEAVTDDWFRAWLSAPPPAPVAVVSATLRLPITGAPDPGSADLMGRAVALAHRARHDPALLGDTRAAAQKRDFVARIGALKQSGADAGPLYRQMHAMLEIVRDTHAPELAAMDAKAVAASARLADAQVLADRTWPFPLYPSEMLHDLKARIDRAFGA